MGFNGIYNLVNIEKKLLNMAIEIVDLTMNSKVDLSIVMWQFTRG